ncbi:MAG: transposase [Turicibacter sp.]|nr:transposase [Turicibacter sp.]
MVLRTTRGPIEGINNKIKVIKCISFVYRSFYDWVTYHLQSKYIPH